MKLSVIVTTLMASTVIANPVADLWYKRADADPAAAAAAATGSGYPSGAAPSTTASAAPSPAPSGAPSAASSPAPSGAPSVTPSAAPSGASSVASSAASSVAPSSAPPASNSTAGGNSTTPTTSSGSYNSTVPTAGSSNGTIGSSNSSNSTGGIYSNSTSGASNSSNGSAPIKGKIVVLVTGGTVGLKNSSDISIVPLFNASRALNISQLYTVAAKANASLGLSSTKGVVIVSNEESLESAGFFSSLVFNTDKPIVVTENGAIGVPIAKQSSSSARGPIVVGNNKLIYPGVFAPSAEGSPSSAAVGIASDSSLPIWFFDNSVPSLVSPASVIKKNYSNFTNYKVSKTPVVPIIYDGVYSTQVISSLSSASGFVVVSAGSNSTLSAVHNASSPIVFAEAGSSLHYVGPEDVPAGTIPAGYLSPVKAQILLSVAAVNGVTNQKALRSLFL